MEASGSEGTDGGGGDAAKGLADEWGHFLPLGEVIGIVTTQPCHLGVLWSVEVVLLLINDQHSSRDFLLDAASLAAECCCGRSLRRQVWRRTKACILFTAATGNHSPACRLTWFSPCH